MVGTRYGQPSGVEEDESPVPESRNARNALKKLAINGKDTMRGGKMPDEDDGVRVYHHRGGSYAITEKTPQAWVDAQPARYRKRQSYVGMDPGGEAEDEDDEPRPPAKKRRRVVSLGEEHDPPSKRTRRSAPETFEGIALDEEEEDIGEDTPRRTRRNLPEVYYGRPRRKRGGSLHNPPRRRRRPRSPSPDIPNSRLYDFAVVGGRDEESCQEAVKRRARMMGYEVEPMENRFLKDSTDNKHAREVAATLAKLIYVNTKLDKLMKQYEGVDAKIQANQEARQHATEQANTNALQEQDQETVRTRYNTAPADDRTHDKASETSRARSASPRAFQRTKGFQPLTPPANDAHDDVREDVMQLGHDGTTDAIPGAVEDKAQADIPLDVQDEMHDNMEGIPDTVMMEETQAAQDTEMHDDLRYDIRDQMRDGIPIEMHGAIQANPLASFQDFDREDTESVEIITERHDSATALTESSLAQISGGGVSTPLNLPMQNKNGNRLRWSLPPNLQNTERAEAAIYHGRLFGESRSARRRRVKRERNIIASWPDRTDTGSQSASAQQATPSNGGRDEDETVDDGLTFAD